MKPRLSPTAMLRPTRTPPERTRLREEIKQMKAIRQRLR